MRNSSLRRGGGHTRSFHASKMRPHERRKALGLGVDPQRFVNEAKAPEPEAVFVPQHAFADFAIDSRLKAAIEGRGFSRPTPIQDGAIPEALKGRDVIGLANTGTGKTAAFLIPIIDKILQGARGNALVVAPTRELATQINEEFRLLARDLPMRSALCVGGVSENPQLEALKRRPYLIVGTPGRIKDFIGQGVLPIHETHTFVLDEADRMLDMGFIHDIRFLISKLPEKRQSLFFSATRPPEVESLMNGLLREPVTISVRTRETAETIHQDVIRADTKEQKEQILLELLAQPEFDRVLVFGRTKWGVQKLADRLSRQGISAVAIHGNKSQPQRDRALKAFKDGSAQVLVATDVAARGIHVDNVSHVINFDPPQSYDDYVHRIGRTGRLDKQGKALTFVPTRS